MLIRNRHERAIAQAPLIEALLDQLGTDGDTLWPADDWPRLQLDRPLGIGARGGHGPIRYWVEAYEPRRRVRFRFERPRGFCGFHEFHLADTGPPTLVHVLEVQASLPAAVLWGVGLRSLHDALIEDALDRAERAAGGDVARPASWSLWVRTLRWVLSSRARRARSGPDALETAAARPRQSHDLLTTKGRTLGIRRGDPMRPGSGAAEVHRRAGPTRS